MLWSERLDLCRSDQRMTWGDTLDGARFHEKSPPATPATRLRTALAACHWSVRHVAPLINWDERTIRHWLSGRYEPPPEILAWLERLAAYALANPPPPRRNQPYQCQTNRRNADA